MTACKFCGTLTPMEGTRMCDSCYEVDKRIDDFVTSPGGMDRVFAAIAKSPEALTHLLDGVRRG